MRRFFVLTPEARKDLRNTLIDVAEDSPDVAARLRSELYSELQKLGQTPGIGHYHTKLLS